MSSSNKFDDIFKEKIQALGKPSSPDWNEFSKKFAEDLKENQEQTFDGIFKNKVGRHKSPMVEKHWELLLHRLERVESAKTHILITKTIEVFIILLFVIQLKELLPSLHEFKIFDATPITAIESFDQKHQSHSSESTDASIKTQDNVPQKDVHTVLKSVFQHIGLLPSDNVEKAASNTTKEILKEVTLLDRNQNDFAIIKPMESTLLADKKQQEDLMHLWAPVNKTIKKSTSNHYLTPMVAYGVEITKTPYDNVYDIEGYRTYTRQLLAGVLYTKEKNNIEYVTGLRLSTRSYHPMKINEYYGSLSTEIYKVSLDKISYTIVDIPLQLKYNFPKKIEKNTKMYVKVGGSANLLMHSKYDIIDEKVVVSQPNIVEGASFQRKALLDEKPFTKGILNGGPIISNMFLSLNAEVGIEHQLSKNNALALGIGYSKHMLIEGIGPNRDQLDAFNINLGFKHKI